MRASGGHVRGSFHHSPHREDLRALALRPEPVLLSLTSLQPESPTTAVPNVSGADFCVADVGARAAHQRLRFHVDMKGSAAHLGAD